MTSNIFLNSHSSDYSVESLNESESEDWMSQLLRSKILQQVPTANLHKILMKMEKVNVSEGEQIITEGDEGFDFYLLHEGMAEFSQKRSSSTDIFTRKLIAGDTFGEEALLSEKPRSGSIRMMSDGILFRLDKDSFIKYIKKPFENSIVYEEAIRKIELGWQWLDVRTKKEFEDNKLNDAINIPIVDIRDRLDDLDKSTTYIVYCDDGLLSNTAVYLLKNNGFDAYLLAHGLNSLTHNAKDGLAESFFTYSDESQDNLNIDEISLLRKELKAKNKQIIQLIKYSKQLKHSIEQLKIELESLKNPLK